jgi:hypothetical protein
VSYRLYWRRNDGVSGHVWLSADDLDLLTTEMGVQGMPWPDDRLPGPARTPSSKRRGRGRDRSCA